MYSYRVGTRSMQSTYGDVYLGQAKEHLKRTVGIVDINLIVAINS